MGAVATPFPLSRSIIVWFGGPKGGVQPFLVDEPPREIFIRARTRGDIPSADLYAHAMGAQVFRAATVDYTMEGVRVRR